LVQAVVGAPDALDEAARPLWRADMDDEVDVAPVDAEVEGRGGDDGTQGARGHRLFHPAPLRCRQRAVVQSDGQAQVVGPPQILEEQLRLPARIYEQKAQPVRLDGSVNLSDGITRGVPDAGQAVVELHDVDVRLGAAGQRHEVGQL